MQFWERAGFVQASRVPQQARIASIFVKPWRPGIPTDQNDARRDEGLIGRDPNVEVNRLLWLSATGSKPAYETRQAQVLPMEPIRQNGGDRFQRSTHEETGRKVW